jgi:hypothetical protein
MPQFDLFLYFPFFFIFITYFFILYLVFSIFFIPMFWNIYYFRYIKKENNFFYSFLSDYIFLKNIEIYIINYFFIFTSYLYLFIFMSSYFYNEFKVLLNKFR